MAVAPTAVTSCVLNVIQTMDNIQHSIGANDV